MKEKELIAIIVIIVVIGAIGVYILISVPSETDNYQTQPVKVIDNYVIAE